MKCRGLLNKHFCKFFFPNIPNETEKIVNFLFSHYKSMGTISCHRNQSSYPSGIKNTTFVEANVPKHVCQDSASSPLWSLRRRFLNIFTKIDPFYRPDNQSDSPIWTKVARNVEDCSINISVKKIPNIPNETEKIVNFLFSLISLWE